MEIGQVIAIAVLAVFAYAIYDLLTRKSAFDDLENRRLCQSCARPLQTNAHSCAFCAGTNSATSAEDPGIAATADNLASAVTGDVRTGAGVAGPPPKWDILDLALKLFLCLGIPYVMFTELSGPNKAPNTPGVSVAESPASATIQQPPAPPASPAQDALSVWVTQKGFMPIDVEAGRYKDYITFMVQYRNRSNKDIRAFRGTIEFQDLFGRAIVSALVSISKPVSAGSEGYWEGSLDYSQFIRAHQELRGHELSDLKVKWSADTVIFIDGSQVTSHSR